MHYEEQATVQGAGLGTFPAWIWKSLSIQSTLYRKHIGKIAELNRLYVSNLTHVSILPSFDPALSQGCNLRTSFAKGL